MVRRCIYCGAEIDLSRSAIIPDALTNGEIINLNVCKMQYIYILEILLTKKIYNMTCWCL